MQDRNVRVYVRLRWSNDIYYMSAMNYGPLTLPSWRGPSLRDQPANESPLCPQKNTRVHGLVGFFRAKTSLFNELARLHGLI